MNLASHGPKFISNKMLEIFVLLVLFLEFTFILVGTSWKHRNYKYSDFQSSQLIIRRYIITLSLYIYSRKYKQQLLVFSLFQSKIAYFVQCSVLHIFDFDNTKILHWTLDRLQLIGQTNTTMQITQIKDTINFLRSQLQKCGNYENSFNLGQNGICEI